MTQILISNFKVASIWTTALILKKRAADFCNRFCYGWVKIHGENPRKRKYLCKRNVSGVSLKSKPSEILGI